LRSVSGGSARAVTAGTPNGIVAASASVDSAAEASTGDASAGDATAADAADIGAAARPASRSIAGMAVAVATGAAPDAASALDSVGTAAAPFAPASLPAAFAFDVSLRRSSLTSVRKRSGVTRVSIACTRSSMGGCVANHLPPSLFAHAGALPAKNMCATSAEPA
jgi:hypothetical protein